MQPSQINLLDDFILLGGERVISIIDVDLPTEGVETSKTIEQVLSGTSDIEMGETVDELLSCLLTYNQLPDLSIATLKQLGIAQGVTDAPLTLDNPRFDTEELGKIPASFSELSFASIDSTCLYTALLAKILKAKPELVGESVQQADGETRNFGQILMRCINWIIRKIDANPLGLIGTYATPGGTWQTWRNSNDSFHQNDAVFASGLLMPFATQVFAFDALSESSELIGQLRVQQVAELIDAENKQCMSFGIESGLSTAKLLTLDLMASQLRDNTIDHMWLDEKGGYFAAGFQLEGLATYPLRIRTSDMGFALNSRFLDGDRYRIIREALVMQLTSPSSRLVSPQGVRTLARDELRFRPGSKYNGSIWPVVNAWICCGLKKYGFDKEADRLRFATLRIASETNCYPSFVVGNVSTSTQLGSVIIRTSSPDGLGNVVEVLASESPTLVNSATLFAVWTLIHFDKA